MKDVLVIIGSHPRTRPLFDFSRTDCDIWVFNESMSNKTFPRADAVFQIHVPPIWRNPKNRNDPGHYGWLTTQTEIPVYMQEAYPDVPMAREYPLQSIMGMIGNNPAHLLSSSVAQAIALAVYLGTYKRIEVYGVAMETNTEYQFQREGVSFWRGFAMGRGIDFYFADTTFECPVYGYDSAVTVDYAEFEKRIAELSPQMETLTDEYRAAIVNVNAALNLFETECTKDIEERLYAVVGHQRELGEKLGELDGARQENMRYKGKADTMTGAAGEFVFSRQEFESSAASLLRNANEANVEFISLGTQLDIVHNNVRQSAKGSPKRKALMQTYRQVMQAYLQTNNKIAILKGASKENYRYLAWLDQHIRAAGGSKSEAVLLEAMNATV